MQTFGRSACRYLANSSPSSMWFRYVAEAVRMHPFL